MSVFETLFKLNVNENTEKKKVGSAELTYLSWPYAWQEVKRRYEDAQYTIWRDDKGRPYSFDPQTGYMVYTTVTINGISHEMWLPVMDGANNAMKAEPYSYTVKNPNFKYAKWNEEKQGYYDRYNNEQPEYFTKNVNAATMFDINKTIMRCLVKNLAMFGLGLYIFAGEDLPEGETVNNTVQPQQITNPAEKTDVQITTANKVPEAKPLDINTPMGYLQNEISFLCKQYGEDFGTTKARMASYRKALIAGELIPNQEFKDMGLEDMKRFVEAVKTHYPPTAA